MEQIRYMFINVIIVEMCDVIVIIVLVHQIKKDQQRVVPYALYVKKVKYKKLVKLEMAEK